MYIWSASCVLEGREHNNCIFEDLDLSGDQLTFSDSIPMFLDSLSSLVNNFLFLCFLFLLFVHNYFGYFILLNVVILFYQKIFSLPIILKKKKK